MQSTFLRAHVTAILLTALAVAAGAQSTPTGEDTAQALRLVRDQAGADLTGGQPVRRPEVQATLEVNEKNSAVAVTATFEDASRGHQFTLGMRAPFDSKTTERTLVTADRLGGDVTASASLTFRLWHGDLPPDPGVCVGLNRERLRRHYRDLGATMPTGALSFSPPEIQDAPLEEVVAYAKRFRSSSSGFPQALQSAYDTSWNKQRQLVCATLQPAAGKARDPGLVGREELAREGAVPSLELCTLEQAAQAVIAKSIAVALAKALVNGLTQDVQQKLAAESLRAERDARASALGISCQLPIGDDNEGALCKALGQGIIEGESHRWLRNLALALEPGILDAQKQAEEAAREGLLGMLRDTVKTARLCEAEREARRRFSPECKGSGGVDVEDVCGEGGRCATPLEERLGSVVSGAHARGGLLLVHELVDALGRSFFLGPVLPGETPQLIESTKPDLERARNSASEKARSSFAKAIVDQLSKLVKEEAPRDPLFCAITGAADCSSLTPSDLTRIENTAKLASAGAVTAQADTLRSFYTEFYRKVAGDLAKEQERLSSLPAEGLFLEGKACAFKDQVSGVLALERGPERRRLFRKLSASLPSVLYLSFTAQASTTDFQWFSTAPPSFDEDGKLAMSKEAKTARRFGVALSDNLHGVFLSIGYSRSNEFKADDAIEVCLPIPGSTVLRCASGRPTEPARLDHEIWEASGKYYFSPELAAHLQLLFDDQGDFFNPHLYLYFLPVKGENNRIALRGGLDVFYSKNDPRGKDGPGARLFFGVPFEIPNLTK
jgi:hypothetical protein